MLLIVSGYQEQIDDLKKALEQITNAQTQNGGYVTLGDLYTDSVGNGAVATQSNSDATGQGVVAERSNSGGSKDRYINPDDYEKSEDYAKAILVGVRNSIDAQDLDGYLTANGYAAGAEGLAALNKYVEDELGVLGVAVYTDELNAKDEEAQQNIVAWAGGYEIPTMEDIEALYEDIEALYKEVNAVEQSGQVVDKEIGYQDLDQYLGEQGFSRGEEFSGYDFEDLTADAIEFGADEIGELALEQYMKEYYPEYYNSTPAYEAAGYIGVAIEIYRAIDKKVKNDFLEEHGGGTLVCYKDSTGPVLEVITDDVSGSILGTRTTLTTRNITVIYKDGDVTYVSATGRCGVSTTGHVLINGKRHDAVTWDFTQDVFDQNVY